MLQAMAFFFCYHCSACFAAYETTASGMATFSPHAHESSLNRGGSQLKVRGH